MRNFQFVLHQNVSNPDVITKLQNQMKEARKVIEQLETDRELAIAKVKQEVHEELELKDQELTEARQQLNPVKEENQTLTQENEKLKTAGNAQFSVNLCN